MNLGPVEIAMIVLAVLLLFGYRKLPDASRSLGRSLRIFKGEMKGMRDDDVATPGAVAAAASAVSGPDPLLRDQSAGDDAGSAADRRAVAT